MNLRTLFLTFSALPMLGFGLPSGAIVEKGNASFHNPKSSHLEVSSSGANVINWDTFSIDEHETLKFIQSKGDAVLNRVTGHESGLQMSRIMGTLASEGSVYIVNPEGVLIGSNALIDVASFVATTLDISSDDFINLQKGKNQKGSLKSLVLSGDSKAKVLNLGTIKASSGDVHMIAYQVENAGNIEAKNGAATLSAGNEAVLQPAAKRKVLIRTKLKASENSDHEEEGVKNSGVIEALEVDLGADGNLYKLAINHSGHIEAKTLSKEGGKIYLTARKGSIEVDGSIVAKKSIGNKETGGDVRILAEKIALEKNTKIDVSGKHGGGVALVGSDTRGIGTPFNAEHTTVVKGAFINASALENGNGGKVVFWGQDLVNYYGTTLAEGGKEGGDGGFVEVSSLGKGFNKFVYTGHVSTLAPKGKVGLLLWDPVSLQIIGGSGTDQNASESGGKYTFSGPNVGAQIYSNNLKTVLNGTNVEIDVGQGGQIRILKTTPDNNPIEFGLSTSRTLTLKASGSGGGVYFEQGVQDQNGNLSFNITAPKVVFGRTNQTNTVSMDVKNVTVNLNRNNGLFAIYTGNGRFTTLRLRGNFVLQESAGVSGGQFVMKGVNSNCQLQLENSNTAVVTTSGDVLMTQNGPSNRTAFVNITTGGGGTVRIGTESKPVRNITMQTEGAYSSVTIVNSSIAVSNCTTTAEVHASGDVNIKALSENSAASIGTLNQQMTLDIGGDVTLLGQGGQAEINTQVSGDDRGPATVTIGGKLNLINKSDVGSAFFHVGQASSDSFTVGGIDIEMHEASSMPNVIDIKGLSSSNVLLTSSGSVNCIGNADEYIELDGANLSTLRITGDESDLTIKNMAVSSSTSALKVQGDRDIVIQQNAQILSEPANTLLSAGRNVNLEHSTSIVLGESITIVTDQAFPSSPNVGIGHLSMVSGARLVTFDDQGDFTEGVIRVFSGYQENNNSHIDDGALFYQTRYSALKGTLDVTDRHNKFNYYYDSAGANPPYSSPVTFYYKTSHPQDHVDQGEYLAAIEVASTAPSSLKISRGSGLTTLGWERVKSAAAPKKDESNVETNEEPSEEQKETNPASQL